MDNSPIFSLETVGRERIIAGSSSHSLLKVFDLRLAGGRAYGYQEINDVITTSGDPEADETVKDEGRSSFSGFNVFVCQNRHVRSNRRRQPKESPIYSLSRPSAASPFLYAGLENSVVAFNFTSAMDPHPDPMFSSAIQYTREGRFDPSRTWFSTNAEPFALTLYEQIGTRNMQMLYQRNLGRISNGFYASRFQDPIDGYDERLSRISTSTRLSSARSSFSR